MRGRGQKTVSGTCKIEQLCIAIFLVVQKQHKPRVGLRSQVSRGHLPSALAAMGIGDVDRGWSSLKLLKGHDTIY